MSYDLASPAATKLWPYHPDWSGPFEITRSFKTDIATSRNRTEQRRALRDVARQSVAMTSTVVDADALAASRHLRAYQNRPAAVPDFSRFALTTTSVSAGASVLAVPASLEWLAVGGLAMLCSGDTTELVEVAIYSGTALTLADPLVNAWPSGSVLRPVFHGLLNGEMRASRLRRGAQRINVNLDAYPGGEIPESEGTAATTFNGYEVFTAEPSWSGSPGLSYLWPVEQVDFDIGRTAQFRPIELPQTLTEHTFEGLAASGAQAIERTFRRMKGRRGAFYRPTTEKDFALAATASSGTSTFLDAGLSLFYGWGSFDFTNNPTAIEVVLTDGTRLHRLVTAITGISGNSRVTVNAAWPVSLTTANVARISWMPLVRFASDDLTTAWRTPVSAAIRASFQSVRA